MPEAIPAPAYRRVVLKLSGEALEGGQGYGIDPETIGRIAREIREVVGLGVHLAVVIGGGNIFRGIAASAGGMDRATGDYMGMLATGDRKSTRLNSSHVARSYAVFCWKKKNDHVRYYGCTRLKKNVFIANHNNECR